MNDGNSGQIGEMVRWANHWSRGNVSMKMCQAEAKAWRRQANSVRQGPV